MEGGDFTWEDRASGLVVGNSHPAARSIQADECASESPAADARGNQAPPGRNRGAQEKAVIRVISGLSIPGSDEQRVMRRRVRRVCEQPRASVCAWFYKCRGREARRAYSLNFCL